MKRVLQHLFPDYIWSKTIQIRRTAFPRQRARDGLCLTYHSSSSAFLASPGARRDGTGRVPFRESGKDIQVPICAGFACNGHPRRGAPPRHFSTTNACSRAGALRSASTVRHIPEAPHRHAMPRPRRHLLAPGSGTAGRGELCSVAPPRPHTPPGSGAGGRTYGRQQGGSLQGAGFGAWPVNSRM